MGTLNLRICSKIPLSVPQSSTMHAIVISAIYSTVPSHHFILLLHSIPPFRSTIPFHHSIPPSLNPDSHLKKFISYNHKFISYYNWVVWLRIPGKQMTTNSTCNLNPCGFCVCVRARARVCVCVRVRACVRACVCVCIYICGTMCMHYMYAMCV